MQPKKTNRRPPCAKTARRFLNRNKHRIAKTKVLDNWPKNSFTRRVKLCRKVLRRGR
jgi:hypothetical protein